MECQDVRQLLAFFDRDSEELDAVEQNAIQKHLDACPDCAALLAQERSADQAIETTMREVAVPAGLKQQLLTRLAKERGQPPWKRWALAAAAAAMLLTAVGGGGAWVYLQKPDFVVPIERNTWTQEDVRDYLNDNGLPAPAPGKFKYPLLRKVEIISIHGQPVPRLTFEPQNGGSPATVFIVDKNRFRTDQLAGPSIRIDTLEGDDRFIFVIDCPGDIDWLRPDIF